MKNETKTLVEWIKAQIRIAAKLDNSYSITISAISTHKSLEKDAENFLSSLPEIEEKLCFGGYIQDKNGTPCCHGDKIRVDDTCGELYWSKRDYCFYYKTGDALHKLYSRFEKVEK